MQAANRLFTVVYTTVVPDNVIGDRQSLCSARLCRDYATGLCFALIVTQKESLLLRLDTAVNHKNSIHCIFHWRFKQQRNHDDYIRCVGDRRLAEGFITNAGMKY